MRRTHLSRLLLLSLALAGLVALPLAGQQVQTAPVQLSEPHRQASFGEAFVADRWPFKYWDKDYLIAYHPVASPRAPAVVLYDATGKLVREVTLWFDNAVAVSVANVAVSKSGTVLVAGAPRKPTAP